MNDRDKLIVLLAVRMASWKHYTWYQKLIWWYKYNKVNKLKE